MEASVTSASQNVDKKDNADHLNQRHQQSLTSHRRHHEEHHHVRVSSRSTLSSMDSADLLGVAAGGGSSRVPCACVGSKRSQRRQRWLNIATVGRALFVISVAFFVVGVLVTVFGFGGGAGLKQLPLQVFHHYFAL